MRVMVWSNPNPLRTPGHPMTAIWEALKATDGIHHDHERLGRKPVREDYDVLLTWNGLHFGRARLVPRLRMKGVPIVVAERGFFKRSEWAQIDHKGFNHTASWAHDFPCDVPAGAMERVVQTMSEPITPMKARPDGYALMLLQKAGDTQLWDAPFQVPTPFLCAVEAALPDNIELRIRPHPVEQFECKLGGRTKMIGGSLRDAVDGARFVITINSNGGNEAIYWGCPVMCIGPAVYGFSGAALACSVPDIHEGMEAMLAGWAPTADRAANYLAWLSTKQYSIAELSEGSVVRSALEAAWTSA